MIRFGRSMRRVHYGRRRRRLGLNIALAVTCALGLVIAQAPALHLLGSEPLHVFPASEPRVALAAVLLSGDMGFHFGMSKEIVAGLTERGIPVVGVSSPVVFARRHTRAQALAVVEQALRLAMKTTRAQHLVLLGQSFGADIVATVAPDLPPDLLSHIDAIALLVPGRYVYFRADPSGLAYLGTPDAQPDRTLKALRGPPVICIYGIAEPDSLCPLIAPWAAKVVPLPGNHHLEHKPQRLVAATVGALHALVPAVRP